jgi:class 3 adenylate cyclase
MRPKAPGTRLAVRAVARALERNQDMNVAALAEGFRFPAEHFASEYERYTALVLSRVPRIGVPALAHVFSDWGRRNLLSLPATRRRLDEDELQALTLALGERESALVALGEWRAPVFLNAGVLGELLQLTAAEREVMVLAALGSVLETLGELLERLRSHLRDRLAVARAVAALVGFPSAEVLAALDPDATLSQTKLVRMNLHDEREPVLAAWAGLAPILFHELERSDVLFAKFARLARASGPAAADFTRLHNVVEIVAAMLHGRAHIGISVMLGGAPDRENAMLAQARAAEPMQGGMLRPARKLTVIMSADVAGYSRLMSDDEHATLETLTGYRKIIRERIAAHDGRVVDSPGDALLAEFQSAVEAVGASIEIQRELAERNAALPERRRMLLRIGLNLGDVMEQDGALYGDGVNIAARLEALARPGGICVSGTVFDQVDGKVPVSLRLAGERRVRNIARPVRVYYAELDVCRSIGRLKKLALFVATMLVMAVAICIAVG